MAQSDIEAGRMSSLLVVAGSGRSGTSLFTGLSSRLGLYIPQPELKPNETNPRGFGEPRWALAFHKELLKSVDVTHDDARPEAWNLTAQVAERERAQRRLRVWLEEQFAISNRVVVKDPRLAPFIELYRKVASDLSVELSVVTMLRHPVETVRSKEVAYGDRLGSAARMAGWLNMMLSVERATRDLPRAIIRYDDLLSHWQETLISAEALLPVSLVSRARPEELKAANDLVDTSLRRSDPDWEQLQMPEPLRWLAEQAHHALGSMAVSPDGRMGTPCLHLLDELRGDYASYYRECESVARSSMTAARAKERRRISRKQKSETQPADTGPHREQRGLSTDNQVLSRLRAYASELLGRRPK